MIAFLVKAITQSEDPITAILTHDWASAGGWSLFVALCLIIVVGFFTETIVPGKRFRRLEISSAKLAEANDKLMTQNGQLITANEITKHFFEETTPKRGVKSDVAEKASRNPKRKEAESD